MKKTFIIFIIIFSLFFYAAADKTCAQEMKSGVNVSQAYPDLGVDMQYYEIKYDPNSDEYISYYQAVREKMMRKLKNLYTYHYTKGDIHLLFNLKSDGSLTRFDIDRARSADDKTLISIVTASLKQASPFPPFPKGLDLLDISFNVVISFKEE